MRIWLSFLLLTLPLRTFAAESGQALEWGYISQIIGHSTAMTVLTNATQLDGDSSWSVALRSDGSLYAWGTGSLPQTNAGPFIDVAAGWRHGIAAYQNGTGVFEWGTPYPPIHTLENWTNKQPLAMREMKITDVAAGDDHSMALGTNGVVYVWGGRALCTNWNGVYSNAVAIDAGWYHGLILHSNGTCTAFGERKSYATTNEWIYAYENQVPAFATNLIGIASGENHNLGWREDGTLIAWGRNDYGQSVIPSTVSNVVMAAAGRRHSMALLENGTVIAWGDNSVGQTALPAGLSTASSVGAGTYHSLAVQSTTETPPNEIYNTFYVAKTGNDSNDGSFGSPWLTIQNAINNADLPGDTIYVGPGAYDEYLVTVGSGTQGNPIRIVASGDATIRAMRIRHSWIEVSGFNIVHRGEITTDEVVRVEAGGHNFKLDSCTIGMTPLIVRTDWVFDAGNQRIYSPSGSDWAASGFAAGSRIYIGRNSMTNNTIANGGVTHTITNISGDYAYISGTLVTETNSNNTWAPIYAGQTAGGIEGVRMIISGGVAATNVQVINNTFTNIFGSPMWMYGNGPTLFSNNTVNCSYGWAAFHPLGANTTVISNTFLNATNIVYYSLTDDDYIDHIAGTGWHDYIQGHIHASAFRSNVFILGNWFENIHQPLGVIAEQTGSTNLIIEGNVFVGFARNFSSGVNGTIIRNNTFYKNAVEEGFSVALNLGGNAPNIATNIWVHNNVFANGGSHKSTNIETGFKLVSYANSGWYSNMLASAETLNYMGGSVVQTNGINGGNPQFVNEFNPRGPDGLPFTADDGLRPAPNSPLATYGIGALAPATLAASQPLAQFQATVPNPAWLDYSNAAWYALAPYERTNIVRPWDAPESLGEVPIEVTFSAAHSIEGSISTNNWAGMRKFTWDFGDGSTIATRWPTQTHVFLWEGDFDVTLTVENNLGQTSSMTRTYRVLPKSAYAGTVYHVATNGNNANPGTMASPFLTVSNALKVVAAGDFIAVHPGTYAEYIDVNRNIASSTNRVSFVGYGATISGFKVRYPYYTVRGFDINYNTPDTSLAGVYVYAAADSMWLYDCTMRDHGDGFFGAVYSVNGSTSPMDGPLDCRIVSCTISNISAPNINIGSTSNWLVQYVQAYDSKSEGDFIRPRGVGHTIRDCWVENMNTDGGGHPDFVQFDDPTGTNIWYKDILIERVWVRGNTNSTTDAAMAQMASEQYGHPNYTNVIVRNCVFENVRGTWSDSIDGLKFHNNLFYFSPRVGGNVTAGGGVNGSSYGTEFYNNVFYYCSSNSNAGWYYNGQTISTGVHTNTTVFADYNLVFPLKDQAPPDSYARWGSGRQELHGVNGSDPLFNNAAAGDFRLRINSPIINGMDLTAQGVTVDFWGQPRTEYTIGPFQTVSQTATPPDPEPEPQPGTGQGRWRTGGKGSIRGQIR